MDSAEFEVLLYKYLRGIRRSMGQLQQHHMGGDVLCELTPAQMHLLFVIRQKDMQKISELSKSLETPDSHVSNMCRKLEKLGYIDRVRDDGDHRVVRVRATEKITRKLGESHMDMKQCLATVCQSAPGEDLKTIITGLEKLNSLLEIAANDCQITKQMEESK